MPIIAVSITKRDIKKPLMLCSIDFQDTVTKLEKKYGVHISLGNIRFDGNHLRGKVTATKGNEKNLIELLIRSSSKSPN